MNLRVLGQNLHYQKSVKIATKKDICRHKEMMLCGYWIGEISVDIGDVKQYGTYRNIDNYAIETKIKGNI